MRLLYSFPDEIGRPGIGTTALHQVRGLAEEGVDVVLYCTSIRAALPERVKVAATLALGGRRIPHRAIGVARAYRYHDMRVAAAIRRGLDVDAVHCWPRATVLTARAAKRAGIPSFREVPNTHTAFAVEVVRREVDRLGMPVTGKEFSHVLDAATIALEESEYAAADILLVPSEYSARTFVERGVPERKLRLHRYGFDVDRFSAPEARETAAGAPLTAIFVGRCEPRKGLHIALRAWIDSGAADRGRFIVCGAFEPGYREALADLLSHPSVEVHGYVANPAELMRASDVFCFPSIEEGSALVTYEARACGCVLLVSEAAGARATDGVDGLVHRPGDVDALTEHLRTLNQDRAELERLRAAALGRSDDLSWRGAAAELAAIYEDVVRSGAASAVIAGTRA
jgi:glycosyltransferase involved in cell wall biosynthesis